MSRAPACKAAGRDGREPTGPADPMAAGPTDAGAPEPSPVALSGAVRSGSLADGYGPPGARRTRTGGTSR